MSADGNRAHEGHARHEGHGGEWDVWDGTAVVVAGLGLSGAAAARALLARGATVTVVDSRVGDVAEAAAQPLRDAGAGVVLGEAHQSQVLEGASLVVTSPGWRPDNPLLSAAAAAGLPVWGDVELAWRLRAPDAGPWLGVTGTNGKTTTVRMIAAILEAAGLQTAAVGNVGTPVVQVVDDGTAYDGLAVELSSFQLHWSSTVACRSAAVLNVAPDHLDWHGSLDAYAAAKQLIWRGADIAVVNLDDRGSRALADDERGGGDAGAARHGRHRRLARQVGFTLEAPLDGQLGIQDGVLIDRAFGHGELCRVDEVDPPAPHNHANALAAAAIAFGAGLGVAAGHVRAGLAAWRPDAHRIAQVATIDGVSYVDDSKATNPHAAAASLAAYPSCVWIAGGLAKGARFDELVEASREHLRAAVLIGRDRDVVAAALARHAPEIPVTVVSGDDTGPVELMSRVVTACAEIAQPGDTVLLAPACASMDQFDSYAHRGDVFAEAVRRLASGR